MADLTLQVSEIRQFLLGQLQEARAEQLEERIFADAEFGEEVEIVEREMIDDYLAGELAPADREDFELRYLKNSAGLGAVEFEGAFAEFIRAGRGQTELLRAEAPVQSETASAETWASPAPASSEGLSLRGGRPRFGRLFNVGPTRLKIAAGLLVVLGIGLWYLSPRFLPRTPVDNSASPERRAWEAELARLNANAAAAAYVEARVTVDLVPMQRGGGGSVPRLLTGNLNQNGLINLRLHLAQSGPTRYRAVFLDEQRNELLAVSNLAVRDTPSDPQIWLLVPSKYFRPGDYQISLRVPDAGGGEEEVNSYTLRVVETK